MTSEKTPVAQFFSGGKDSVWCLSRLEANDAYRVSCLVTTIDENDARVPMHGASRASVRAQAKRLGYRLIVVELPSMPSNDVYRRRVGEVFTELKDDGIETVAYGDLLLEDVRRWRADQARSAGMEPVFPIWGRDTDRLARQFIDAGWRATITGVDTDQIDTRFLGKSFDEALLEQLPDGVDPCGENGEFHTFVWDGPLFSQPADVQFRRRDDRQSRFRLLEVDAKTR